MCRVGRLSACDEQPTFRLPARCCPRMRGQKQAVSLFTLAVSMPNATHHLRVLGIETSREASQPGLP